MEITQQVTIGGSDLQGEGVSPIYTRARQPSYYESETVDGFRETVDIDRFELLVRSLKS